MSKTFPSFAKLILCSGLLTVVACQNGNVKIRELSNLNKDTTYPDCAADNVGGCVIKTATKSALEPALIAGNIVSGMTIFGITGTATASPPPANCTVDGAQAISCTALSGSYWTTVPGVNVTGANGTLVIPVPAGYYDGSTTTTASDTNLVPAKILSGVTIFGITGTSAPLAASCSDNILNASACTTTTNRYVTGTLGTNITGTNGSLSTTVSQGFYNGSTTVTMSDTNLINTNIKSGVTIFGITGTSAPAAASCSDNALNAAACTTATSRYVTGTLGSNITGADGSLTATVPLGFYNGTTTVAMSDTNLVAAKILSGVTIFGITGTSAPLAAACTDNTLNAAACTTATSRYVTGTQGANISGANGSLSTTVPQGYYDGTTSVAMSDTNLTTSNIKSGVTIFGVSGLLPEFNSNAFRNQSTTAISQLTETTTYAGGSLPAGYRDVPDIALDDDGFVSVGTTSSQVTPVTRGTSTWSVGVARKVCGKGITTLTAKISDCSTQHSVKPTWDAGVSGKISWNGAVRGNGGQGSWTLVSVYSSGLTNGTTCDTTCKEVWMDDRTHLVWSEKMTATDNWCRAAGNAQGGDPSSICNSSTYQPSYPTAQSWCAEVGSTTMSEVTGSSEIWTSLVYQSAKAGVGKNTTPSVRWRLPTMNDYHQANVDGMRFVLPGMTDTAGGYEWTSTVMGSDRSSAYAFSASTGITEKWDRTLLLSVRCVGR